MQFYELSTIVSFSLEVPFAEILIVVFDSNYNYYLWEKILQSSLVYNLYIFIEIPKK